MAPDQGGVSTLGSLGAVRVGTSEAAGPRKCSMVLVGVHKIVVVAMTDGVLCSSWQSDCDDNTMALMALMTGALGGRVTCRNNEMVAQPMRLLLVVASMLSSPTGKRGTDYLLTMLKRTIISW